jgi:Rieske Fe-S protein
MEQGQEVNRRSFMSIVTWAIGALIGVAFAIPGVAYIIGPTLRREEAQEWIRLGSASKVELGVPTLFKVRIQRKTGWIVNEEELAVYVRTDNGRDFVAMSNVCTHLGCRVRWITDDDQFFCPCHNAFFDSEGGVVSGPPPRALDRYEVKVEDGQLFVLGG